MKDVPVAPGMVVWARQRAGLALDDLAGRFPRLPAWEAGEARPTLRQLEAFARTVHVPIGYLFLPAPPDEHLPIPDFRTIQGRSVAQPSPDLLDMVHACQERQAWYREFAQLTRQPEVKFVGSARVDDPPERVAAEMANTLNFDVAARAECRTWEEALRQFVSQAEQAGVMVMASGIVLSNTSRPLDPQEFRGFALADRLAPLVFINAADTRSGQMFTLAHELAHIWLGASAVSDAGAAPTTGHRREEVWCNAVAAELLVPLAALRRALRPDEPVAEAQERLARQFKVSTLVVLRRLLDVGRLPRAAFEEAWAFELDRLRELARRTSSGGDFYRTTLARVSRRFARALVESTLEGQTLYRDAFRMLGVAKTETFNRIGRDVGVMG